MAAKLVEERVANGAYTSWANVKKRVRRMASSRIEFLKEAGFYIGAISEDGVPGRLPSRPSVGEQGRSPADSVNADRVSVDRGEALAARRGSHCSDDGGSASSSRDSFWENKGYPVEFERGVMDLPRLRVFIKPNKRVKKILWGGTIYEEHAYKTLVDEWYSKYPILGVFRRKKRFSAEKLEDVKNICWSKLQRITLPQLGSKSRRTWKKLDIFRIDHFGNVVSKNAKNRAICSFQVDHIFPLARGGRNANDNIWALYWGANKAKSDHILQTILHDHHVYQKLTMGMRKEQLIAMFEFIWNGRQFRDKNFHFDRAIDWLNMTPPSSKEWEKHPRPTQHSTGDFNLWTNGSSKGEVIYNLLKGHYDACLKTGEK